MIICLISFKYYLADIEHVYAKSKTQLKSNCYYEFFFNFSS